MPHSSTTPIGQLDLAPFKQQSRDDDATQQSGNRLHVGSAAIQQQPRRVDVAFDARDPERRLTVALRLVDVGTFIEETCEGIDLSSLGCGVQRELNSHSIDSVVRGLLLGTVPAFCRTIKVIRRDAKQRALLALPTCLILVGPPI